MEQADIPKFHISLKKCFMDIPNEFAFSNINQEGRRTIKGSMIMVFSEDPKEVLTMARGIFEACAVYCFTRDVRSC